MQIKVLGLADVFGARFISPELACTHLEPKQRCDATAAQRIVDMGSVICARSLDHRSHYTPPAHTQQSPDERSKLASTPIRNSAIRILNPKIHRPSPIAKKEAPTGTSSAVANASATTRNLDVSSCSSVKPIASQRYGLMVLPMHGCRRIRSSAKLRKLLSKLCTASSDT